MHKSFLLGLLATFALCAAMPSRSTPQSTAFTYQGQLTHQGEPYTGLVDLQFQLWDDPAAGNQVAALVSHDDVPVDNGVFTVEIDFGTAFGTEQRWIEIIADGTPLLPRQPVTPAPVALFALSGLQGPMGPEGPIGPEGPQGETGPAGPEGTTGQLADTVFSTGQLVLTQTTTAYTLIPGLTRTITVPANAKVFVSTNGGFQNAGTGTSYAVGDFAIFINGAATPIQRQVAAANSAALGQILTQWTLSGVFNLAPGTHTIQVRARDAGGTADGNVAGTNDLIKGNLSVMIIKQ